jgi:hypothetical protein
VVAVADGVHAGREECFGHAFADDGYALRGCRVLWAEGAAGEKRDLHGVEVADADGVVLDVEVVIDGHAGNDDVAVPTAFMEGEGGKAGGAYAGQRGDALFDLLKNAARRDRRLCSRLLVGRFAGAGRFRLLKPVSILVMLMRLRRKRPAPTMSTSESATCEMTRILARGLLPPALRAAAGLELIGELQARGAEAGMVPKRIAVATVTARVKSKSRQLMETSRGIVSRPPETMRRSRRLATEARAMPSAPPARASSKAFGEQLADDADAACSEGLADGQFAGAGGGAGEQQVGDVGAGDEQDQRDDGHEDLQRLGELSREWRCRWPWA